MKAINGDFYFFYSHSRNIKGMPCEGGTAVLLPRLTLKWLDLKPK